MDFSLYIKKLEEKFTDKYGMVLPQPIENGDNSGNGLFYTAMDIVFRDISIVMDQREDYQELVRNCYKEKGCLMRNPDNTFGQEQWDNYLGVAVACLILGERKIPREILWYAITHGFRMDTDGKLESKDFLIRFPQIWVILFIAAFPLLKYLVYPIASVIPFFFTPKKEDTSGNNLQFMYNYALCCAYDVIWPLSKWLKKFPNGFKYQDSVNIYFGKDHPFIDIVKYFSF